MCVTRFLSTLALLAVMASFGTSLTGEAQATTGQVKELPTQRAPIWIEVLVPRHPSFWMPGGTLVAQGFYNVPGTVVGARWHLEPKATPQGRLELQYKCSPWEIGWRLLTSRSISNREGDVTLRTTQSVGTICNGRPASRVRLNLSGSYRSVLGTHGIRGEIVWSLP